MTASNVRVRFAPSPTGHLHVGGARTAIFNWLFARHHDGDFIIRVEDTDAARSTRESEEMVLDDLRWLGLTWDEGPDVGGPYQPYRQSERLSRYAEVAAELLRGGHAYRCFCTEDVLEQKKRAAEAEGRDPQYDLTCCGLAEEEIERNLGGGVAHVIRFHVPKDEGAALDGDVTIDDAIRGRVSWKKESLGDFIVLRSDGMPTYNFSVVVDDHDMAISHVIRAEEHLTNTHRQVLISRALGWSLPVFAHVSLILGTDRSKLSKRHGATSVSAFAEQGFLPEAMMNYLTLLGWMPRDEQEIFTREKAVAEFELARLNSAPAVFDEQKLTWMNGQYLRQMAPAELFPLIRDRLIQRGLMLQASPDVEQWFVEAIEMAQTKVELLSQLVAYLSMLFEFAGTPEDEEARVVLEEARSSGFLAELRRYLEDAGAPLGADAYKEMTEQLKQRTGLKGKALFMPLRVALTGQVHGPELQRLLPLLEKGSVLEGIAPVLSPLERVIRLSEQQ